jgi:hypothetical protein
MPGAKEWFACVGGRCGNCSVLELLKNCDFFFDDKTVCPNLAVPALKPFFHF